MEAKEDMSHFWTPSQMAEPINDSYDPEQVEKNWWQWWCQEKLYELETSKVLIDSETGKNQIVNKDNQFVIVIPPPNVTGNLHLGHTLTCAVQDALVRWHRMCNKHTVWVPGCDHAGIATQTIVEKHLYKTKKLTRHDLGRDEFLKAVWEWKSAHGDRIIYQLKRLGISADWSREAFTMNQKLSTAVIEAFIRLFDANMIYREKRLVSWCPFLKTALSDIEVDPEEITCVTHIKIPGYKQSVETGYLWTFTYNLLPINANENVRKISVSTTRIETMLGDVAVAVHTEDERYKEFIGKKLQHPFFPDRDVVVVADNFVDPDFGTGAVKITPAHDKNDYELALRHNLPFITIFTLDGHINENGGIFQGQHRFQCRVNIEKKLKELGLFVDKKPHTRPMNLPRCSRSKDIVEYMIIPQWWLKCTDAAKEACLAVEQKQLRIIPKHYEKLWFHWLENIKDWCISRQLWWGHRIPAYEIVDNRNENSTCWVAARTEQEAKTKAEVILKHSDFTLKQDEDVLDTWFSSALFPFSVFGWPENTDDIKTFFPTTLLETGYDILFFWVARMVMMSLLLLNTLPFKTVLLHNIVRDAHGKKMSKSLGNVIDPIDVINGISLEQLEKQLHESNLDEKELKRALAAQKKNFPKGIPACGSDALRFGLIIYNGQKEDINLDINRIVGYRHFCNKIWNACRFALRKFPLNSFKALDTLPLNKLNFEEKWILMNLKILVENVNEFFQTYSLSSAAQRIYEFWIYKLCDVYIELFKHQSNANPHVLHICLVESLKLLHPFMPVLTEELYHRLPPEFNCKKSISIASFPQKISWLDELEFDNGLMESCLNVVHSFRSFLSFMGATSQNTFYGYLKIHSKDSLSKMDTDTLSRIIVSLTRLKLVTINIDIDLRDALLMDWNTNDGYNVYLIPEKEKSNINKITETLEKKLSSLQKIKGSNKKSDQNNSLIPQDKSTAADNIDSLKKLLSRIQNMQITD